MTTSDKTADKLVASIRRTKAAAALESDPPAPTTPAATRRVRRVVPKAESALSVPDKTGARDPYRSVGRVWPD